MPTDRKQPNNMPEDSSDAVTMKPAKKHAAAQRKPPLNGIFPAVPEQYGVNEVDPNDPCLTSRTWTAGRKM